MQNPGSNGFAPDCAKRRGSIELSPAGCYSRLHHHGQFIWQSQNHAERGPMKTFRFGIHLYLPLLAVVGIARLALAANEPVQALGGLDPVELTQGKQSSGKDDLSVTHGRYRYLLASAETKKKFETAPGQYGIQFDGFCMKMGPLSGRGSPERYLVSDNRIYLFASDSCRNRFKADPAAYTDRADAPPTGTDAERTRGQSLLESALRGFGGADKVD